MYDGLVLIHAHVIGKNAQGRDMISLYQYRLFTSVRVKFVNSEKFEKKKKIVGEEGICRV